MKLPFNKDEAKKRQCPVCNLANNIKNKDMSKSFFVVAIVIFALFKLLLSTQQLMYITPQGAPIDDELMYDMARSLVSGNWLGEYNWLTLSKYPLFSFWVAFLHLTGIPYLLGGQLLYTAGCVCGMLALAPIFKSYKAKLFLFIVLLFNPLQTAAAVQLRVYRENITSALALLLFVGFAGAAIRYKKKLRFVLPWLIIGGAGLAGCYLNREDGAWYLVFCIAATLVTCVFIAVQKDVKNKVLACAVHVLPYAVLALCVVALSLGNLHYYDRFTVSDFTSAEFSDACGALMRVSMADEFEQIDMVPVTRDAINIVAQNVPQFEAVAKELENEFMMNNFGSLDTWQYSAGGFYWALRNAVYNAGYADTAPQAQQYYTSLAKEINALCDSGQLPSGGGEISTTLMPFKASYIPGVLKETALNLARMISQAESTPYFEKISITPPDLQAEYETFLSTECNIAAQPNTDNAYYNPVQQGAYFIFSAIAVVYAVFLAACFVLAVLWQVLNIKNIAASISKKTTFECNILWWVQLGFLLSVILRCAIIGYMFTTSFNPWVGRIGYLCGAQPALILFCFVGAFLFLQDKKLKKQKDNT